MCAMRIHTKKEVRDGIAGRVVSGFEGILKVKQLPSEYLNSGPQAHLSEEGKHLFTPVGMDACDLVRSMWYPEDQFQKAIKALHIAGNRLHEINQKIKKLKAEWHGEETFVI